jgi:hypothetical protein
MPRRKDLWAVAIICDAAEKLFKPDRALASVTWLPVEPSFCFLADPFGIWVDQHLHMFVEHYDYRTRHGTIERLIFDRQLELITREPALAEPWHLSYPFVFEADGVTWMMPEAHRSGALTLYRAHAECADWRAECTIVLDCVPVDASMLRYAGRWWLFYSPATSRESKIGHLHVAWADDLCGPWTVHPGNPVRRDARSSRPGGTPMVIDGRIMLPVQDCSRTYGGAVRPLWIDRLDESSFSARIGEPLALPNGAPSNSEGMHTLSACGPVTLVDVKTIDRSLAGLRIDLCRMLRRPGAR